MDAGRLRRGEWLALAGAVVLLGSLFVPWYAGPAGTASGWVAFSVVDCYLALTAAAGAGLAALTAARRSPSLPVAAAVVTTVLAIAAVAVVVWRLIDVPADGLGLRTGAFIGLGGALVTLFGACASLRDDTGGADRAPAVPVQQRPAPPAAA